MNPATGEDRRARHGTRHGYRDDRCKCDPCKKAIALDHNLYKLRRAANGGGYLTVDKTGAVRRLQALMALGWPRRELARRAGYTGDAFAPIINGTRKRLTLDAHRRIVDLYDALSMTPGPSESSRARNAKWPVPLAWDDDSIDDPEARPVATGRVSKRQSVDWAVIERFLTGEHHLPTTLAERREIVRRWQGSMRVLDDLGWKPERYADKREDVT